MLNRNPWQIFLSFGWRIHIHRIQICIKWQQFAWMQEKGRGTAWMPKLTAFSYSTAPMSFRLRIVNRLGIADSFSHGDEKSSQHECPEGQKMCTQFLFKCALTQRTAERVGLLTSNPHRIDPQSMTGWPSSAYFILAFWNLLKIKNFF